MRNKVLKTRSLSDLKQTNSISVAVFLGLVLIGMVTSAQTSEFARGSVPLWLILSLIVGFMELFALKIANQWEKAVVLRFGKFNRLAGPGMFLIIPLVETIPSWIDHRVMVTPFAAQKTLTKDTVPVDVDAVLFWVVWDAQKAALEVEDYRVAVDWAAQTALRDIIGRMMLAEILVGRSSIDKELQQIIDQRTTPWGIAVQSVEIRWTRLTPSCQLESKRRHQDSWFCARQFALRAV